MANVNHQHTALLCLFHTKVHQQKLLQHQLQHTKKKDLTVLAKSLFSLERETGFEPATFSLGS
ncbi:MAG: hypothetical protein PHO83_14805, partial [Geobacteraceae bacterium]|nr:hypothetical protein [Geobacteraceae bacterium]